MTPPSPDIPAPANSPYMLIRLYNVLSPMIQGKAAMSKLATAWNQKWAASLASAVNAGQWTQARKAKIPKWNISDTRCQLCLKEQGTLQHRFKCEATAAHRCQTPIPNERSSARQEETLR